MLRSMQGPAIISRKQARVFLCQPFDLGGYVVEALSKQEVLGSRLDWAPGQHDVLARQDSVARMVNRKDRGPPSALNPHATASASTRADLALGPMQHTE